MTQQQDATRVREKLDLTQEQNPNKGGLFAQVSMPTVLAAGCASATAFLLSSRLGLTGSLIGAVLVTAVSTIATQVYKNMINRSVDRIADLSEHVLEQVEEHQDTVEMYKLDRTQVRQLPVDLREDQETTTAIPVAPAIYHEELKKRQTADTVRRSFVVAVVAALAALAVYTVLVNVATGGKGIGPSISQVVSAGTTQEQPDEGRDGGAATADAATEAEAEAEAAPTATDTSKQQSGDTTEVADSGATAGIGMDASADDVATTGEEVIVDAPPAEGESATPEATGDDNVTPSQDQPTDATATSDTPATSETEG